MLVNSLTLPAIRRLAAALGACAVLLAFGAAQSRADVPIADPFYAAPAELASLPPGAVIRSRSVRLRWPIPRRSYDSYEVLYRTAGRTGEPVATVATIAVPRRRSRGPRRLVSYQVPYDGLSPACRPSDPLGTGRGLEGSELLVLTALLERGWSVVVADYEGPQDQWGVAATTAHGVLDGIRAAQRFRPAGLDGSDAKVGLLGYSGGGNASAWAIEAADAYAPELDLVGSAQGGIAPEPMHLVRTLDGTLLAGAALAGIASISSAYPELDFEARLNPLGRSVFRSLRSRGGSCAGSFIAGWPFMRFAWLERRPGVLDDPDVQAAAAEQNLGQHIPQIPTLWLHTTVDELGSYRLVRALAARSCRAGQPVRFISTDRVEHFLQSTWLPFYGIDFLAGRFAGKPMRSDCAKLG